MRKAIALSVTLIIILAGVLACTPPQASPLADKIWLSPGKIRINNLHPGNTAKEKITLHNGRGLNAGFLIYYRVPDYVENTFEAAPAGARDWISIGEDSPLLGPRETKEIQVILALPAEAQTPRRWEFWIGVREKKDSSFAAELCSRWLITMGGN